jgi:Leucine-rich repeat (LRR) protein
MTFVNAKRIQVINLAKNGLRDFSQDTFRYLDDLRIVDLSSNDLVTLPETTFQRCRLEKIDLSDNNFDRIPSNGFSNLATMDLVDLDLSHNKIGTRNSRLRINLSKVSLSL